MRVAKEIEGRKCPKCGNSDNQTRKGFSTSGLQRCFCNSCKYKYTLNPKNRGYTEEIRRTAIREYYSGISARGVGKLHNMSKANVLNWIKKTERGVDKSAD
jgi:transposase-like protein